MKVLFKKLNESAKVPSYGSVSAAGADIYALLDSEAVIDPGETLFVHTGIAIEIPEGYVGLICARSGLSTKHGLAPANKVGVIDSDYRGEIVVALYNHKDTPYTVTPFERIAQLVIVPYLAAEFEEVDDLNDTSRGIGGFGSTGTV